MAYVIDLIQRAIWFIWVCLNVWNILTSNLCQFQNGTWWFTRWNGLPDFSNKPTYLHVRDIIISWYCLPEILLWNAAWYIPIIMYLCIYIYTSGWWFQTCVIFHNIWDNPSHWLTFFKMVKTTNQIYMYIHIQLSDAFGWSSYRLQSVSSNH